MTTTNQTDLPMTLQSLKMLAASQVAKYPQYAGHFDNYRLARIKRDIRTKMGLAFIRGEYVIAVERKAEVWNGVEVLPAGVTAWSRRNSCDTYIRAAHVEWL